MSRLTRNGIAEPVFSGADGDREIFIFPVQLTTSRIGNLTRLIHTLAICDDHTYIHIYLVCMPPSHGYGYEEVLHVTDSYNSSRGHP